MRPNNNNIIIGQADSDSMSLNNKIVVQLKIPEKKRFYTTVLFDISNNFLVIW